MLHKTHSLQTCLILNRLFYNSVRLYGSQGFPAYFTHQWVLIVGYWNRTKIYKPFYKQYNTVFMVKLIVAQLCSNFTLLSGISALLVSNLHPFYPHNRMSIYLLIYVFIYFSTYIFVVYLHIYLFMHSFICLLIYNYLLKYTFIYTLNDYFYLSIHSFMKLFVYIFVY
jgi:hypothetical protein